MLSKYSRAKGCRAPDSGQDDQIEIADPFHEQFLRRNAISDSSSTGNRVHLVRRTQDGEMDKIDIRIRFQKVAPCSFAGMRSPETSSTRSGHARPESGSRRHCCDRSVRAAWPRRVERRSRDHVLARHVRAPPAIRAACRAAGRSARPRHPARPASRAGWRATAGGTAP